MLVILYHYLILTIDSLTNRLVKNHLDLQKRFEESSKLLEAVTAQASAAATRAKIAESQILQLSPSAGERILLATPDVVFLTVVALCTPQTLAALSRSCRAVHGRVGYAVRVARTSRDLDLIESNSSSLIIPKIKQAAKSGILRAVHAIHAWSPHMGSSNFAPQKSSATVPQDDSFSLGETALSSENADAPMANRGRTGSIVTGSIVSASSSSTAPPSLSSPATGSSISGGIFGFGARRPAASSTTSGPAASSAQLSEKDLANKQRSGGGLFVSPNKPDEDSNSSSASSGGGGAVDYKKVEELMIKLKAANSSLMNLKRSSDDMRMKLETAEGVKKHLAQQVRQLEENIAAAVRDKDTALHEKSQNLEVIRFLDDRVASLETRLESSSSVSKENVSLIEEKNAAINGLQLRIAYLEEDVKKSKAALSETKAHMVAADARVADAEARAQALESLAMNLSPDMLLDGSGGGAAAKTSSSSHEETLAPLRQEIKQLKNDRDRLSAELRELKSKRDLPREDAVWTDERGEASGLKIEINRTRKERDDITKQRDDLLKQGQALTQECDSRRARIDALEKEVEKLTRNLAEKSSVAASDVESVSTQQPQSDESAVALDQFRAEHAAETQSWKQARNLLAKEVKKLRGELAELQARFGVSATSTE